MLVCVVLIVLLVASVLTSMRWVLSMLTHFPKTMRTRWFEKSADVCPIVRKGSGSPQRRRPWWRRQGTISKGFVNSTEVVTEITCNRVNFLRNQNGTKGEDKLLGNAFLLGVDVADM